jgi:general secretion pathway protein K
MSDALLGRRGGRLERGAALLVVMVAVALITAVAVDLAYQTRVNLQIAGHARDELRAVAQAKGAVALARLVLHFQAQIDDAAGAAGRLGGAGGAAGAMPRPQIWKLIPLDSSLTANLFAGAGGGASPTGDRTTRPGSPAAPPRDQDQGAGRPLGSAGAGPEGTFSATLEDEDRKVNVQLDALYQGGLQGAQLDSLLALVADRRWDFLFDHEDAGGQRTSRTDLAVHLKDWVDDDQVQSAVTGVPEPPFENGFGDENFAYDRGADRYKAKNARFDSLEELHLVTGVSDAFMAAFGDRLTVYLSRSAKMNINTDDREELLRNARIMADPPLQPILSDPGFPERLEKAAREIRLGGLLPMTPNQFAMLLRSLGLGVRSTYLQPSNVDLKGAFTDRSRVFHVRGSGQVGEVEKTIDTVVTFDPDQAREQAALLGRLLHWHEE